MAEYRLRDFIDLAKQGQKVSATVRPRREAATHAAHPEETEGMRPDLDYCCFAAEFEMQTGTVKGTVRKVYNEFGKPESAEIEKAERNIANDKLKEDYRRMKEAGIEFTEEYFV